MNEDLPLTNSNLAFAEALYADYVQDPSSVSEDWATYFRRLNNGDSGTNGSSNLGPSFQSRSIFDPAPPSGFPNTSREQDKGTRVSSNSLQDRADQLIRAYRVRGH